MSNNKRQPKSGTKKPKPRKPKPLDPRVDKETKHWQVVEGVVAGWQRIHGEVPGLIVTQRAQLPAAWDPTVLRDIDVLVEYTDGQEKKRIGIEVKDQGKPIDIGAMGQTADLRRDVGLDEFWVVSASGFSVQALLKATHEKLRAMTIAEFEQSDIWSRPAAGLIHESGPQIVHVSIIYKPEAEAPGLADLLVTRNYASTEAVVEVGGQTVSLVDHLVLYGRQEVERRNGEILNAEMFAIRIFVMPGDWTKLIIKGTQVPIPEYVDVVYKFLHRPVSHTRHLIDGKEFVSFEADLFGGPRRQVILSTILDPEGGFRVALTHALAKPSKVKM